MSKMIYGVATCDWVGYKDCIKSWKDNASASYPVYEVHGKDILTAYQEICDHTTEPIIAMCHDDLMINEKDWDLRVLNQFDDPKVGLVGFAGAPGHGAHDMYKSPYHLCQLGRVGFRSNMKDAALHGAAFTGEQDCAVLDGLSLFVRRTVLEEAGGWPLGTPVGYIGYDYWICCMTRRLGYKIRLVGVSCDHLGGKSTGLNPSLQVDFEGAHRYIYDEFKDVLPYMVEGN